MNFANFLNGALVLVVMAVYLLVACSLLYSFVWSVDYTRKYILNKRWLWTIGLLILAIGVFIAYSVVALYLVENVLGMSGAELIVVPVLALAPAAYSTPVFAVRLSSPKYSLINKIVSILIIYLFILIVPAIEVFLWNYTYLHLLIYPLVSLIVIRRNKLS